MTPEQALAMEEQTSASGLPGERPESTRVASIPTYLAGLTGREVEVLRLVARGMTNAQAGESLFISPRTVDTHLTSIYNKLGGLLAQCGNPLRHREQPRLSAGP
jgi:DNA-binding CsgD family transcriptional regulator